ncbi:GGDEF domain-containing protein [Croceicoccus marinus]|uniref:diguanylate cyclase n=1 Tax=Croceicoccus marinus TaxID=450378 RepID=A0A7G6VZW5_9SPHN|nr:diguanylate cyclase [Croceicoccus marinus]QNE07280.1 diguanylate cyclase [Croceicoccus marinus]
MADTIRSEFRRYRHELIGEDTELSASFGVAAYGREHSMKSAFQLADKTLYQAKANGRNRVCRGTVEVPGTNLLEKPRSAQVLASGA